MFYRSTKIDLSLLISQVKYFLGYLIDFSRGYVQSGCVSQYLSSCLECTGPRVPSPALKIKG